MRIGIYGGSFDPIHVGHLIVAEQCREQARLDQVWFVPSAVAPHKRHGAGLTDRQRIELIELAIAGNESLICSEIELNRGGVSYTVDTLNEIRELRSEDELFLLMGSDSLHQFSGWREPKQICDLAIPLVVNRPGSLVNLDLFSQFVDRERLELIKDYVVTSPLIEISSSNIRARVSKNQTIRYIVPRSVEKYIESQKLYRLATPTQR